MATDMTLTEAAYDWLTTDPVFAQLVAEGYIGTEAAPTDPPAARTAAAWVFQGLDEEGSPFRNVEGTGKAAIVLSSRAEWASPNRHNTASFPLLQVLIYVDSSRTLDGMELIRDAVSKAQHIAKRVDRRFHLVANKVDGQRWGNLYVHSSLRSGPKDIRDVPGTQSRTVRVEMKYETLTD